MNDAQWLAVANAVCEVQSRCALMVAGDVELPALVTREYVHAGVCAVFYDREPACVIVVNEYEDHVSIRVAWSGNFKHLESNA